MLEMLFWIVFVTFALIGLGTVLILIFMGFVVSEDAKEERKDSDS